MIHVALLGLWLLWAWSTLAGALAPAVRFRVRADGWAGVRPAGPGRTGPPRPGEPGRLRDLTSKAGFLPAVTPVRAPRPLGRPARGTDCDSDLTSRGWSLTAPAPPAG
jgi:hypothetical protein